MLAQRADTNPLTLLPPEVRPAVARLWLCNHHLLQTALALCSTLRVYLDEQPITTDDVNRICATLLKPAIRAKHKFASDLLSDLSLYVAEAAQRNESRAKWAGGAKPAGCAEASKLADSFGTVD